MPNSDFMRAFGLKMIEMTNYTTNPRTLMNTDEHLVKIAKNLMPMPLDYTGIAPTATAVP